LQCSGGRKAAVRKINLVILQACHRLSNAASIGWRSSVFFRVVILSVAVFQAKRRTSHLTGKER